MQEKWSFIYMCVCVCTVELGKEAHAPISPTARKHAPIKTNPLIDKPHSLLHSAMNDHIAERMDDSV